MSLIRIATALAATAMASPALAADVTEPAPADPWEFYIGAHAGVVWGDGEWEYDVEDDREDIDGSRGIFGLLAGVNYRFDSAFLGLEGDVGFAEGKFAFESDFDACGHGAWCDANGHIRVRAGMAVADGLDLFIAGGVALADGNGSIEPPLVGNDDLFVGWSLGAGVDFAVTDHFKLRVEYLYDDYGHRHPYSNDSNYHTDWADNTVRGAAIFTF